MPAGREEGRRSAQYLSVAGADSCGQTHPPQAVNPEYALLVACGLYLNKAAKIRSVFSFSNNTLGFATSDALKMFPNTENILAY